MTVSISAQIEVPPIGQGTWRMGDDPARADDEVAAIRYGIDLGMTLIDTAELYADGVAEEIVGRAIEGRRDDVCIVSKVLPENASEHGTVDACHRSLKRLGVDHIDVYLLHWRREIPLVESVAGFERLVKDGAIRAWGVSNLDVGDLEDLPSGVVPSANQVLYNLVRRGPEANLIPWCRERGTTLMAYSPVEKAKLLDRRVLREVASARGVTPAQIALAWVIRDRDVIAIPKAVDHGHLRDNAAAMEICLTPEELEILDGAFPAPGVVPLETLS
ncbi:aldo/keto reductase [Gordonia sp. Z-3]|uniref:aldo/keto reductase n=1 Tax=Gordonia sp. Z-3 TaxID=3115408 RepID=UPI002E2D32A4|nr:aldo/keto reductase [Gordonia sp. Z-3]MED5803837.1 aldo/keto reductase [Gordonia sp. Z-3]